jgi:hypothetical protein
MPTSLSSRDSNKTNEMIKNLRKLDHELFAPSFEPDVGFCYNELESFNLKDQVLFFKALEKAGAVMSDKVQFTILKCSSCDFPYFCIKYVCTICRSSNIVRGTAIEHDSCGNVDFDYNFMDTDGKLKCGKCQEELKAVGVDYSKINNYYKCLDCKLTLQDIEHHYGCLHCGRFLTQEELQALQLFSYKVDGQKLSSILNKNNYVSSLREGLINAGINSNISHELTGTSKIQHTFDLVAYSKDNLPVLVLDVLESSLSRNSNEVQDVETVVLSYISKCVEVKVLNRILICFQELSGRVKQLANAYQINMIETSYQDDRLPEVVSKIVTLCNMIKNTNPE